MAQCIVTVGMIKSYFDSISFKAMNYPVEIWIDKENEQLRYKIIDIFTVEDRGDKMILNVRLATKDKT